MPYYRRRYYRRSYRRPRRRYARRKPKTMYSLLSQGFRAYRRLGSLAQALNRRAYLKKAIDEGIAAGGGFSWTDQFLKGYPGGLSQATTQGSTASTLCLYSLIFLKFLNFLEAGTNSASTATTAPSMMVDSTGAPTSVLVPIPETQASNATSATAITADTAASSVTATPKSTLDMLSALDEVSQAPSSQASVSDIFEPKVNRRSTLPLKSGAGRDYGEGVDLRRNLSQQFRSSSRSQSQNTRRGLTDDTASTVESTQQSSTGSFVSASYESF